MLSPVGRCKVFDAAADGYVRSEGCAVVILKRLHEALADGDNVLAVVRGTAVNQDGRTRALTVTSAAAQQAVMDEALHCAGVAAADVSYVEVHTPGLSQSGSFAATRMDSGTFAFKLAQPAFATGRHAAIYSRGRRCLAPWRTPPLCRSQRVWSWRHERAYHPGGSPGSRTASPRAAPRLSFIDALRARRRGTA